MICEILLIIIVSILVYSGAILATAGLIAMGFINNQLPRKKFTIIQNGDIQVGDQKINNIKPEPNVQEQAHPNVQGAAEKPDITPNDHYDEYDDVSTLQAKDTKYLGKIKNIVVDGANLIHYIMGGKHGDYFAATEAMIRMVCQLFPKKNIFITLKEPNDPSRITERMKQKLTTHKIEVQVQPNQIELSPELAEYLATFEEYSKLFSDKAKLHFVFGVGQDKARDDHTAILVTDLLGAKTALLSRDRYRDIINITGSRPSKLLAFGPLAKKIQKKFDGYMDSFSAIGSWSIYGRILGYTCAHLDKTVLWSRKPKNSSSSEHVLLLGRDVTDQALAKLKKAKGNDVY
jgi:hypothetical protein